MTGNLQTFKIAVVMSDNRPLTTDLKKAQYNSLAACINYHYCLVHGYDFYYCQPFYEKIDSLDFSNCIDFNTKEPRHPAWSKLLSISKILNMDYDFVVYIDTDAVFRNLDYKLTTFIETYLNNKNFIFLDNSPNLDEIGPQGAPCSGFFVVKNNSTTKQNIKEWYNFKEPHLQMFNNTPFFEQHVLWSIHRSSKIEINVVPEVHFHEKPGQLIRHMHSGIQGERVSYFTSLLSKLNLNLSLLKDVRVVCFDTALCEC